MTLKVLDPYKDLVERIAIRLKEWRFGEESLFDVDEEDSLPEEFLEKEGKEIFSCVYSASSLIDWLIDIVEDRPHLAYDICRAVADAVPTKNPPAEEPHEIWDYLQGFLNHSMIQKAAKQLIIGWSLSGDADSRERARQMRAYFLDHLAEDVRKKVVKARIEQVRARAKEAEVILEAICQDQEELDEDEGVKGFSGELYEAMHALKEAISSGISLLIRADNEIAPRLLKDLTLEKRPANFAAYVAAHMYLSDEAIRTRLEALSKDETLAEDDRFWFAWAFAYVKSED